MPTDAEVDALRRSIDLVAYIGQHVQLTLRGREARGLCPFHLDKNPSLNVVPAKQIWNCFSCNQHEVHGADVFGFVRSLFGDTFPEAVKRLQNGNGAGEAKPIIRPPLKKRPPRELLVPPEGSMPDMERGDMGKPLKYWTITTLDGKPWMYECRYVALSGPSKETRPFSFGRYSASDPPRWECRWPERDRPFYGLDQLGARPNDQVMIHEAAKKAEAAAVLFPRLVHLGFVGGCNAVANTDLSVLKDRRLVMLPDNDRVGVEAMQGLCRLAMAIGAKQVSMIDPSTQPDGSPSPEGWDVADTTDWTPAIALAWAKARKTEYAAPQVAMRGEGRQVAPEGRPEDSTPLPAGAAPDAAPETGSVNPSVAPATPEPAQEAAPLKEGFDGGLISDLPIGLNNREQIESVQDALLGVLQKPSDASISSRNLKFTDPVFLEDDAIERRAGTDGSKNTEPSAEKIGANHKFMHGADAGRGNGSDPGVGIGQPVFGPSISIPTPDATIFDTGVGSPRIKASPTPNANETHKTGILRHIEGQNKPPLTPTERAQAQETLARSEVLSSMVYRKASSVRMRATDWLWPGKIPLGEICVIQGDPGLGKSQITASLCAIITRGGQWPLTREPCDVGSVIVLSAEDSTAKTIVPRLAAAGADLDRVTILQSIKHEYGTRGFSLLADMLALDTLLGEEDNPMAVIVDPISAYQDPVGAGAKQHDSHKNTDVRSLLRPVSELVDRRNVTMILINHLTKGAGRAITRGQGNMAFVAGPRAVWQVSKDKDDPRKRLFLPVKNNLADDSGETGLSFSVEPVDLGMDDQGKSIKTSRILWNDEKVTITADEAAGYDSLSQDERGSVSDAQAFLAETLADGRMKVKDVETLAKASGHSFATLGRAKRALGVISEREGFGREAAYYWRLPEQRPPAETRSWVKDD